MSTGSRRIVKYLVSALGLLLITVSGATAEIRGYIPVQLRSFTIPTLIGDGRLRRGPISMFLVVRGQENVAILCRYLPRVREAIAVTVDQSPIPIVGNKYQFDEIGVRLHQAINKALPHPLVIRLHLLPMVRRMGDGAVNLELPGTDEKNCLGIRELPLDVVAMLVDEDPEAKTFSVPDPETRRKPVAKTPPPKKPVRRGDAPPTVIVKTLKPEKPKEKAPDPTACRELGDVWPAAIHKISGTEYWLERTFTLDEDSDGAVDNVGFILKAEGKPNKFVYYFPGPGRQSIITVPTLRLEDDRDVAKICFGQKDLEKPELPEEIKTVDTAVFKAPDLAAELAAKTGDGGTADKETADAFLEGPGLMFAIVIGAGLLLIATGGVGFAVARYRADRRRRKRRAKRKRRGAERRQDLGPFAGPEQRDGKNRRSDANRRADADRRTGKDRRGG